MEERKILINHILLTKCTSCGKDINKNDATMIREEHYCKSCLDKMFTKCDHCHKFARETRNVDNKNYCIKCISKYCRHCDGCDDYHLSSVRLYLFHNDSYCQKSLSNNNLYVCSRCNCVTDDIDEETGFCSTCLEQYEEEHGRDGINDYDYTPDLKFYGCSKKDSIIGITRTFGFENEVYGDSSSVKKLCSFHKFVYLKSDGSLNSGGYEIVSHPMTFEFLKTNKEMNEVFEVIQKKCKSFKKQETGLHVHVNKSCLSNNEIIKLIYFFKNNHMDKLLINAAQRNFITNNYCKKTNSYGNNTIFSEELIKNFINNRNSSNGDRYSCVNFQNHNTIEFRIFKGNSDKYAVIIAVEIINTILDFIQLKELDFFSSVGENVLIEFINFAKFHCSENTLKRLKI